MTFARGLMATIVILLWVNKRIGNLLFRQVESNCWGSLIFRCSQGALSLFNGFLILKYFYVSTISIVGALTPFLTCILSYFILGSSIKWADIISLIVIFLALRLILTGSQKKSFEYETDAKENISQLEQPNFFITLALLS